MQKVFDLAKLVAEPGGFPAVAQVLDLVDTAACLMDAEERIKGWNRCYERFFPEHIGRLTPGLTYAENLERFFSHNVTFRSEEQLREKVQAGLIRHRGQTQPFFFQLRDGRWLKSQNLWLDDGGCIKLWTDVTEEHNARFAERGLAEAIAHYDLGFALFDKNGCFVLANRAYSNLFPYTPDLFHPKTTYAEHLLRHARHSWDEVEAERLSALAGRPVPLTAALRGAAVFRMKNGGWMRLEEHVTHEGGIASLWIDITEIHELDETNARLAAQTSDLRRLAQELREARDAAIASQMRAEQANRTKSGFLAMMSHELRTPLNAVIGLSDAMLHEIFGPIENPRYKDYAHDINAAGRHQLDLINDLLDLSRIEAGRLPVRLERIDPATVVEEASAMLTPLAEEREIVFEARIDDRLDSITADRRALVQIAVNLLSNAVKFTPPGGKVRLALGPAAAGGFTLTVADTGIGMTEVEVARALELFVQIDNAWTRQQEGTGLGLPMVKGLVEMHGGTVRIDSSPHHGTTVTAEFPCQRAANAA